MEKRIICPVCNAEKMCIEESQGDFTSYMCFRCGYMSDARMEGDSEFTRARTRKQLAFGRAVVRGGGGRCDE